MSAPDRCGVCLELREQIKELKEEIEMLERRWFEERKAFTQARADWKKQARGTQKPTQDQRSDT